MNHYAHTLPGRPDSEWQILEGHLRNVAERAARFAEPFGGAAWAGQAGRWHDLGKYSAAFQKYLREETSPDPHGAESAGLTDHSTAGAQHAVASEKILGHILAYVISGHHSGLLDGRGEGACLEARLNKGVKRWDDAPASIVEPVPLELPHILRDALTPDSSGRRDAFSIAFFTRMLFSCVVDADFLDTERFLDPGRSASRPAWPEDLPARMERALDDYIARLDSRGSSIDRARTSVRQACLRAASLPPGLFSLTVPTGGGKTLSSFAFGLRHALRHGHRRLIYVIPFTSIIEQNARVFRKVLRPVTEDLGMDPVLEHHCTIDVGKETTASRLATENWDAPLVVTTAVRFYESLFANRTSRCRRLHNLARSVIILDEAQTLPVDSLEPCLRALRELTCHYGASVVLCTATQPAIRRREDFPPGLEGVREIIPDPRQLYRDLKRVDVIDLGRVEDEALSERLLAERQVLCVVNTRGHARRLFDLVSPEEGGFHLSASMCPAHRSVVLEEIRKRLNGKGRCRVVSTQLIEAGVDIDFPVVYRSLAGLDSIAQAAGRCNRNGRLPGRGRAFIFRSEHERSERFFAETADCAAQVLGLHEEPLALDAVEHYFRLYYWEQSDRWDSKRIIREFALDPAHSDLPLLFAFRKVARAFHLIEESGRSIVVPWGDEGRSLCEALRTPWITPNHDLLRRLQRYSVQIPVRTWNEHAGRSIELIQDRYPVLTSPEMHYDERTGLSLESEGPTYLGV